MGRINRFYLVKYYHFEFRNTNTLVLADFSFLLCPKYYLKKKKLRKGTNTLQTDVAICMTVAVILYIASQYGAAAYSSKTTKTNNRLSLYIQ
jgi:hypothetical protein